jgi:hypothetical protein
MTKDEIASVIRTNLAALEAALQNATPSQCVFAWPDYNLGVRINGADITVCGVNGATIVKGNDRRTFKNGAGKPAVLMSRTLALETAIVETRKTLACFA